MTTTNRPPRYLVVTQHAWRNESGCGVGYACDGIGGDDRAEVFALGFEVLGHDDFNIATIEDGRIVAFGWGLDDFGPDEDGAPHYGHDLDGIAQEIGLTPSTTTKE